MSTVIAGTPALLRSRPGAWALGAAALALLLAGFAGWLSDAWGYGLFAAAALLLLAGSLLFAVFMLSREGDSHFLQRGFALALGAGAAAYVLAVFALSGFYVHETVQGRIEWYWVLFGPAALAALVVLDIGVYRKLVANNLPTWRRYRSYISRELSDPAAMRQTLVDEVLVQRSMLQAGTLRWLRHALIFWGFLLMFGTELAAVFVREGFPAFGWRDLWREPGHPLRLGFDLLFDVSGLMVLAGCVLALIWRMRVNGTPEQKYSDTPTVLFLLFVVVSGFIVEGWRIAPTLADPVHAAAFAGRGTAWLLLQAGLTDPAPYRALWLVHALGACVFIAYVPVKRLIHSCATPMGRMMNSQKAMLAAKKKGVLGAMLVRRERL